MIASFFGALTMLLVFAAATPTRAESPQNLYTLNCWGCHRAKGEGVAGTAPPLTNAADFLRVPGGREYLIRVPGVSQSMLDDADTALVMNWILETFSKGGVGADFKPFTAAEIHHARAEPHLFDITKIRTQLLRKMVSMKIRSSPVDATAHAGPHSGATPPIEE
jgi:mono/diheme cytochrome c family protein